MSYCLAELRINTLQPNFEDSQLALIVYKPSGLETHISDYSVAKLMRALMVSSGLNLLGTLVSQLPRREINTLYPILTEPSEYGEEWKELVRDHLTYRACELDLISGNHAHEIARGWQKHIRQVLLVTAASVSKVVSNFIHVPERCEMDTTWNLFKQYSI